MFRTIVVPLDGSQLAEQALPRRGARLVLTRAVLAAAPANLDGSDWEVQQTQALAEPIEYLRMWPDA